MTQSDFADFGIYLHWPFCSSKCPYCDFNSHVRHHGVDEMRFAAAFLREMTHLRDQIGDRIVTSIFIGGGTPSLMQPATLAFLLQSIHQNWSVAPDAEITMEANPSSADVERFHLYRSFGVNRLSLGVQALDNAALQWLGRGHNVQQARDAIELARSLFPRLSFDLIYAREGQTELAWEKELTLALELAADHLSLYQLTIEAGTAFHSLYKKGKLHLPKNLLAAKLYYLTQDITQSYGLPAYEISNHATQTGQSRHNLIYWRYQQYAGFGPGAHGRFIEASSGKNTKRRVTITEKNPERWLHQVETHHHGIVEEEYLDCSQQADESLLMGLRLHEGLDLSAYEALAGKPLSQDKIKALQEENMVEMTGNHHLRATIKGRILLNYIITQLI